MIPARRQYRRWSLPSKWSYWAAVTGIPIGLLSLALATAPFLQRDTSHIERNNLLFQVAQELRYNREWLFVVAMAVQDRTSVVPVGSLRSDALMSLVSREYERVTKEAYGEEKYIYQEAMRLKDLGHAFGSPKNAQDVERFNKRSRYRLHDLLFLNDFLHWYLRPLIETELSPKQLQTLGWTPFPGDYFTVPGVTKLDMMFFVHERKPITEFSLYLGLID